MPTQDKRYARMRSAVQIKSQAYKLTKANNSRSTSTSSTYQLIYSKTLKRRNSQAHQLTNPKTHQLINAQNSRTHKLINSELTSSSTYKLKKTSTYQRTKLKIITFILQHHFNFHSILAKIQAIKLVKSHYSYSFTTWNLSNFKLTTCILHHFAFLDWLLTHNFSDPKTHFLPLKSHFLTAILPFLVMCLML